MRNLLLLVMLSLSCMVRADVRCEGAVERFTDLADFLRRFDNHSIFIMDAPFDFTPEEINQIMEVLREQPGQQDGICWGCGEVKHALTSTYPATVEIKINRLLQFLSEKYERVHEKNPVIVNATIRRTSNTEGFAVRPNADGGDSEGLHDHKDYKDMIPKSAGYVWTVKGAGLRIEIDGQIVQIGPGKIAFFGALVRHGSPDSDKDRFVILGSVQ